MLRRLRNCSLPTERIQIESDSDHSIGSGRASFLARLDSIYKFSVKSLSSVRHAYRYPSPKLAMALGFPR